ncbi:MAG: hypothetical protein ACWGMZ_10000, partial [Thermoguttaceae bacterium]
MPTTGNDTQQSSFAEPEKTSSSDQPAEQSSGKADLSHRRILIGSQRDPAGYRRRNLKLVAELPEKKEQ